jgi:hypothetical protein
MNIYVFWTIFWYVRLHCLNNFWYEHLSFWTIFRYVYLRCLNDFSICKFMFSWTIFRYRHFRYEQIRYLNDFWIWTTILFERFFNIDIYVFWTIFRYEHLSLFERFFDMKIYLFWMIFWIWIVKNYVFHPKISDLNLYIFRCIYTLNHGYVYRQNQSHISWDGGSINIFSMT